MTRRRRCRKQSTARRQADERAIGSCRSQRRPAVAGLAEPWPGRRSPSIRCHEVGHGRSRARAWRPVQWAPVRSVSASDRSVLDDLRELVAALDRRVPHLDRKGERDIARDAAALRAEAMNRIREIENEDLAVTVTSSIVEDDAEQ